MAWRFSVNKLHRKLSGFVQRYCPILKSFEKDYHWSIMQAEYATDIVFKRQQDLQAIYPHLLETLIQSVKPENIASFLGRKLHGNYQGDMKWCNMRKSVYSLVPLQELLAAATKRYLGFISEIETPEIGVKALTKITTAVIENNHSYKGFNLLADSDSNLLRVLLRGEFNISGFTCRNLRQLMPDKNGGQVSRLIKRLRVHRLIKRVGKRYKYYLTQKGRQISVTVLKLREMYVIPKLAEALA